MGGLGDNTFFPLWDHIESWASPNAWLPIFFILIFLGVLFEVVCIQICTWFQKKLALTEKKFRGTEGKKKNGWFPSLLYFKTTHKNNIKLWNFDIGFIALICYCLPWNRMKTVAWKAWSLENIMQFHILIYVKLIQSSFSHWCSDF